jgi:hypothetical protein
MVTLLDTERARQGHTGDGVRYVLGTSLVFAVLAMGVMLASFQ